MPDWKEVLRERLAPAKLNPAAESEVVDDDQELIARREE